MLTELSNNGTLAPSSEAGWWAVYTRHQHEKVIAHMLEAKGLEVFLPLYETVHRWKDRRKSLTLPLFPGYLFIRERSEGRLLAITTPGIHMILMQGGRLAVISAAEIEGIQRALADPTRVEPYPFLKCGERVRVIRGPLLGVQGILVRKKNLCRLILSVELLSQSAAVEVQTSDVEPAASSRELYGYSEAGLDRTQHVWTSGAAARISYR